MNDRMHIETFLAELDADIAGLDELVEANAKAAGRIRSGAGDDLDWAALGYTIYIYNTLESQPGIAGTKRLLAEKSLLFCRRFHRQETTSCVSPTFFENDLPAATWRRELAHLYHPVTQYHVTSDSYDVQNRRVALQLRTQGPFRRSFYESLPERGRCPKPRRWPVGVVRHGSLCARARCARRRGGRWR